MQDRNVKYNEPLLTVLGVEVVLLKLVAVHYHQTLTVFLLALPYVQFVRGHAKLYIAAFLNLADGIRYALKV